MTQPGFVAPTTPGWWVRTNRIGTNKTGYNWDITAVGGRDSLGRASGSYDWAGSAAGLTVNLRYIAGASVEDSSITIPAHQAGDLIVICATSFASIPVKPDPPSTGAPNWIDIDSDGSSGGMLTNYFIAVDNATISGPWNNSNDMMVAVFRGQGPTPIGAHAIRHGATGTTIPSPSGVTLTNDDGSSQLLYFYRTTNLASSSWDPAPAGYTRRAATTEPSSFSVCFNTKDDTTSDGVVNQGTIGSGVTFHSAIVEILN